MKRIVDNQKIITDLPLLSNIFIRGKGLRIELEKCNNIIQ